MGDVYPLVIVKVEEYGPKLLGLAKWVEGCVVEEINPDTGALEHGINFPGLDEVLRASEGEYVVKMSDGELKKWTHGQYQQHRQKLFPPEDRDI